MENAEISENAEERRLFYVAITRAKDSVHIISDSPQPSQFIDDIFEEVYKGENIVTVCGCCEDSQPVNCQNVVFAYYQSFYGHNFTRCLLQVPACCHVSLILASFACWTTFRSPP